MICTNNSIDDAVDVDGDGVYCLEHSSASEKMIEHVLAVCETAQQMGSASGHDFAF